MATSQGDGSIILNTKVDTSGVKKGFSSIAASAKKIGTTVGKAFIAIGAAATASAVSIVKSSADAYAEYEQLVGGVETLFKGSSAKLIQYANEAYRTTGQSANEYMQNVTSFSASLLNAVGGDTEKAADIANAAMISISDNVNKMGSSAESVTMAFQGFAKQQYMLLDNLKLGYGGTKTEMERLLKDAQAITGVEYNIENLADVYTAIGVIQEKLGIAGTTAKEAATTISGSAATMRAAWQNVLTAISGGGDLDRAINNLVDSISNYFDNIAPVVERALSGVGRLIEKVAPMLVQTVARSLIQAIPSLLNAVYEMVVGLAKGIYQGIIDLISGTTKEAINEQSESIEESVKNQNDLTDGVKETAKEAQKATAGFDEIQKITNESTFDDTSLDIPQFEGSVQGSYIDFNQTKVETSAFENFIKETFGKISLAIKSAWSSEPVQAFWGFVQSYGQVGLYSLQQISSTMWSNFKATWMGIEGDFNTMTTNMNTLWTNVWADLQIGVETWGPVLSESVSSLFNSIYTTAIDPVIQLIMTAWTDFTSMLVSIWQEYGAPLVQTIGEFANNVISFFQSIYDNVLEPIVTPLLDALSSLWHNHLSGMVNNLIEFIAKLIDGALRIYNEFIHPIVTWLTKTLEPIFTWIGNTISGTFHTIVSVVSDALGGVFDALGGLIDFIVGVFTGDWEKAWNGIKAFFTGIWDAIWGVIKGVINAIIDGLNFLWGGLYGALAAIINGVGGIVAGIGDLIGADWGWEIPKNPPLIPRLAKGAVLPPNKPFLAMVGDQKSGTNIEAPLSTIQEAVSLVMNGQTEMLQSLLSASVEVQGEILEAVLGIQIGDDIIGRAFERYQRKMVIMQGG